MKNKCQKKQKGGVNATFAAVTGAVIGAGVAVAGAMVMKDKKNQAKVKKIFTKVKNQTTNYPGKLKKEVK